MNVVGATEMTGASTGLRFDAIPDAPMSSPRGEPPGGTALPAQANGSLCGQGLAMPTTLVGQNGAQVSQSTQIAITGCRPSVETKGASAVTELTATLNATVDPDDAEVTGCEFEYGTTPSYGLTAPCSVLPGSGNSPVAVSAALAALAANTSYHFRISAKNGAGTSNGSDGTFTTLPNPLTDVTEPPSSIGQATATLNATVNPNGAEVSKCEFEYGPTTTYGSIASCASLPGNGTSPVSGFRRRSRASRPTPPSTSASSRRTPTAQSKAPTKRSIRSPKPRPLTPPTTSGSSRRTRAAQTPGSDATFTTLPDRPEVVTGVASSVTQTSATLNATVNPSSGSVSDCHFEYGPSAGYGLSTPCTQSPGSGSSSVPSVRGHREPRRGYPLLLPDRRDQRGRHELRRTSRH